MIGAIDPVDQRQNEKRSLPSHSFAHQAYGKHYRRTYHVEGERPEMAFRPNLVRRLTFGQ